jgi:hypothetical protein
MATTLGEDAPVEAMFGAESLDWGTGDSGVVALAGVCIGGEEATSVFVIADASVPAQDRGECGYGAELGQPGRSGALGDL